MKWIVTSSIFLDPYHMQYAGSKFWEGKTVRLCFWDKCHRYYIFEVSHSGSRCTSNCHLCIEPRRLMYSGLYLSPPCVKSCKVGIKCPLPRPLQAQSTSSLPRDWPRPHQQDFPIAKSAPRCWTLCVSICHLSSYFLL
jgi:hypothetical protein